MEQRWGFLVPWCDVLSGRLLYRRHGCAGQIGIPELQVGDMPPCNLQVGLPSRSEMKAEEMTLHYDPKRKVDLKTALQYVQEALALLVAVKHVDYVAWRYLLLKHCQLDVGREGEEEFEAELPARFELYTDLDRDKASNSNLVHFCGVYQREHRSAAYLKTLARIAALDGRLGKDQPAVDIKIPVRIAFLPGLAHIARCAGGDLKVLMDIRTAERTIRKQWKAYSDDDAVSSGTLRCTFELSPMVADFDEWAITSKTTEAMESLALGDVWFSQLSLAAELGPELEKDELQSRKTLGKLMTRVLNAGDKSRERSLGALGLFINAALKPGDFEAVCSAIVLNQMTKNLSLGMWMDTHRWKWLAYSLFSKRARACSTLESLALLSIHNMRIAEMKEFAAILASKHPEEELFNCPRGAVEGREATLKHGAPIRWQFDDKGEAVLAARELVLEHQIPSVRTFSDDGESAWVNVLIPGYGRCQVQREDLEFHEDNQDQSTRATELTSLTLGFSACCAGTSSGLPVFLRAVGSTLKRLTLNGPRVDIDENWILESCPSIKELSTCGGLVDARLNFCGYRASNTPFPELNCYWDDVAALASDLQDPSNPLSNCVHRLRVRLNFIDGARRLKAAAKALLQMLQRNKSLEFLEVVVQPKYDGYFAEFRKHHRQPINRVLKPLPRESKAAFISVLSSQHATKTKEKSRKPAIGELDHVVKNIFAFAADPVLREVYFCRSEEAENEVKWDEVTI